MLKNAPTLAIGGVDTEENEQCEVCPLSVSPDPPGVRLLPEPGGNFRPHGERGAPARVLHRVPVVPA